MLPNFLSVNTAVKICMPIGASLLLFCTGCGRDHNCSTCATVASDSPSYQQFEQIPSATVQGYPGNQPVMSATPSYAPTMAGDPNAAPPINTAGLRGPRSQAELDAVFAQAQVQQLPPMPERAPVAPTPAPGPVSGEPSWNAPMSREWRHIVVHHSASPTGCAAAFDKAHRDRGWDGLGYHFVIGNGTGSGDGQVEVGYRWPKQQAGAHAGNYEYNQHGVGICLVGDFEKNGPPSPRQMASLRQLIGFLQARCNIPSSQIIGHGNVPGRNTECPGRHLDMNALRASMGGAMSMRSVAPVPAPVPAPIPAPVPTPEMAMIEKTAKVYSAKATQSEAPMLVKTVAKP